MLMSTPANALTANELRSAIVRNPLVVNTETPVMEAIARMIDVRKLGITGEIRSSCVLVVEGGEILGILTKHDVMCLSTQRRSLETVTMRSVMTAPVITMQETEFTDFSALIALLQQHHIQHLPILDNCQRLLGIVTLNSLWQKLYAPLQTEDDLDDLHIRNNHEQLTTNQSNVNQSNVNQRWESDVSRCATELKQSEQRFISLTRSAPVGIYRTDDLGNCRYVNDCWCQIAGLTPAEAEGFGWINSIHPSDRELVAMEWNTAIQENRPFQLEYRFQNQAGEITWAYGQAVAEHDESGKIIGYIGTITDISDRKATEQALKLQRDFNQLIAEISSRFIDIGSDRLDAEIERTLQLIGEATNSDTSYLIKFSVRDRSDLLLPDGTVSMTHEWTKPEYSRKIALVQNMPLSIFPWANAKLLQREIVNIPRVADAPSDATIDQASWQQFNIVSSLLVPLIQKSVVTGTMGFASFSDPIDWDEEIIRLLQVMAQTIANAQQRTQDEQQLYESEERLRLALRATNQGLYDLNLQTGEAITSLEYATMLGYNPATFQETNAKWIERLHPDDREHTAKIYQDYVADILPEYKVEFRQYTQMGEWKWILSLGRIVSWDETGHPLRMLGTHTDISDRKQAEAERLLTEQVRQELNLLESIFDTLLAGYWDWDLQTNEEYLSPKFKKMFGYEDHELPNSPETWQHLIFSEDLSKVLDNFDRHVHSQGEVPFSNEVRYRHKDGSTIWVICSGQVIEWDENVQPLRMIGCHIDITDRKLSEEQLRKSDVHLKTAQRIGKLGSWEFDPYTEKVTWSDEVFHIFGCDPAMGTPNFDELQQRIHPDDQVQQQQMLQIALANAQPYDHEIRFYRYDGTLGYFQSRGEPIVNETGHLKHMIGTVLDITDRKQAEVELQNLSDRLTLAVKAGEIGIWDWNVLDNMLICNDRMYELYGFVREQVTSVYETWVSRIHTDDRPIVEAAIQQSFAGEKDFDSEFRVVHPDGSIRFIKTYSLVKRNAQGEPIRMIGMNIDITDQKRAEAKLKETSAQLVASNRELEAFAYSVSHDLRSPLRAIDGFSKALLEDYGDIFDADGKDYFERIRSNVTRMGTLIDDLLRLSRVSRSEIEYRTVNLSILVQEQLDELQTTDPERQVEIVIAPNVCVSADSTLMRVVISNLIQNAWKFTSHHDTALIEFGMIASENQQDDGQLTYFVRDNGAGFDMNYAKMLFGVFQRLHNTNEFAGTGIGLATVQRAIHRHGGRVWAEGAVEKGATIYFTLPNSSSQELK
jgi:PAS domain S-box-containing protein